jgi:hypothetical protein
MHVVIVLNGSRLVAVFGTKQARPFRAERSASQAARRYEKRHAANTAVVMRIEPEEEA